MPEPQVDLGSLFSAVSSSLAENRDVLNSADGYNANHGDNMVQNFRVITRAVNRKKNAAPSEQLAYASQALARNARSGSAQLYSQGLARAAENLRGQKAITQDNAMVLLESLLGNQAAAQPGASASADPLSGLFGAMLGGGAAQSQPPVESAPGASGDPLSGLLGAMLGGGAAPGQANPLESMVGGGQAASQADSSAAGDTLSGLLGAMLGGGAAQSASGQQDMLGGLMSALAGGGSPQAQQQAPQQSGGMNLNTLLTAGMAFLQARQQGATPVQALVSALLSGTQMNSTPHHSQSGQLVATSLINTLTAMLGKNR